jgi:secreted protein, putative
MALVNLLSLMSVLTFAFAQHFGPPQFSPGYGSPFHHFGSPPRGSERGPLPLPQGYLAPNQPSSHRHIGSSNQDSGSFPHLRPTSSSSSGFVPSSSSSSSPSSPSSSSSSSSSSNSGSLSGPPYMPPPPPSQSSSNHDSIPSFGSPSQPSNQGFGHVPSQDPSSGFNLPPSQSSPNQPDLGLPFVPRGPPSAGHRQSLPSLTNSNPMEEDPQVFQAQGSVPPPPSIDWGNCPQLEPEEQEKIEKAAVIKQCLDLIPLPQNITQESVDQHRSDIAKCALTKENWFTSEGKYRYEKAQSEIKSKKLTHNIEVSAYIRLLLFNYHLSYLSK